jgi:hypothetical protein
MVLNSNIKPCEQSVADTVSSSSEHFLIGLHEPELKIHLLVRRNIKDHEINLAIPVSGIRFACFLFAKMNSGDCLLSVVICSHNETTALWQSLDPSKWPMAREEPFLLMTSCIKTSVTVLPETRVHCATECTKCAFHSMQLMSSARCI